SHPKSHNQTNHLAPASYDESFAEYNSPGRYYNKELKSSNPDAVLLEVSPDLLKLTSSHFPQHHESVYFCPLSVLLDFLDANPLFSYHVKIIINHLDKELA